MSETRQALKPGAAPQEGSGPEVVVIGNLTIDDVVHANGETTMASPGGNTIHTAIGARIWGVSVGVVARVGADFPAAALDRLREAGIDTLGLHPIAGPTVRNWVVYEEDGRRTWVYRTAPERSLEVAPGPEDLPAEWTSPHGAYPCRPRGGDAVRVRRPHRRARPGERAGAGDAGHPRSLGAGTGGGPRVWRDRWTCSCPAGRNWWPSSAYDDPERACRELLEEGLPAVVVKCGAQGAVVGTSKGRVSEDRRC